MMNAQVEPLFDQLFEPKKDIPLKIVKKSRKFRNLINHVGYIMGSWRYHFSSNDDFS